MEKEQNIQLPEEVLHEEFALFETDEGMNEEQIDGRLLEETNLEAKMKIAFKKDFQQLLQQNKL